MFWQLPKKIRLLILAIILSIVLLGVYALYIGISRQGKIAVSVTTVPADSHMEIDGKSVISSGTVYLTPGKEYTIKAMKDGFQSTTAKEYVDEVNNIIAIGLQPVSDEAKKWAQDNQSKYDDLQIPAGEEASQHGEHFTESNPITQVLPYENLIYTIGYRADPTDRSNNSIIIIIDAPEGARNAAIQQIRDLGYDPLDYKIEFSDYRNPFAL